MSKRWEPVEDGEATSFTYVDNGGKLLGVFAGDDYTDWYAMDELPDNIRLCRQVEADAPGVTVPSGVREAIRSIIDLAHLGAAEHYTCAPDEIAVVEKWLDEAQEAQTDEPA